MYHCNTPNHFHYYLDWNGQITSIGSSEMRRMLLCIKKASILVGDVGTVVVERRNDILMEIQTQTGQLWGLGLGLVWFGGAEIEK